MSDVVLVKRQLLHGSLLLSFGLALASSGCWIDDGCDDPNPPDYCEDAEDDTSGDGDGDGDGDGESCNVHCFSAFSNYSIPMGGGFPTGTTCMDGLNTVTLDGEFALIDATAIEKVCPITDQAGAQHILDFAVCSPAAPPNPVTDVWSEFVSLFSGVLLDACIDTLTDEFGCDEASGSQVCVTYLVGPVQTQHLTTSVDAFTTDGSMGATVPWTCDYDSSLVCQ